MGDLKELRAALSGTDNTGGVEPTYGAVEFEAKLNKKLVDASPKFSELLSMIPEESIGGQPTFIWNVRTSDQGSSKWGYSLTEGGDNLNNTIAPGAKAMLQATAVSLRTDWEVDNYFKFSSESFYNALADEASNAVDKHLDVHERQIVTGTAASGYGSASGYLGLRQIVNSYVTIGDTTSVYGVTRAPGKTYMDAQVVDGAAGAFAITMLDKARTAAKKRQVVPGMFVCSYERQDEINSKLQAQQRFTTIDTPAGFTVPSYLNIPIVGSRYMDKAGESNTDTKIFLLAQNNLVLKTLYPTQNKMVDLGRADATGGMIKDAKVLVSQRLDANVVIDDITEPSV